MDPGNSLAMVEVDAAVGGGCGQQVVPLVDWDSLLVQEIDEEEGVTENCPCKGANVSGNENEKTKKMVRGKVPCKGCGGIGHMKGSYKCPLTGTKKRNRKPRKNTTKGYTPKDSTPNRTTKSREEILLESPEIVTRRRLAQLTGENASSQEATSSQPLTTSTAAPKKMTPKKAKKKLHV